MARIITTHYRYKRPPKKKPKAATLDMPAVATIPSKRAAKANQVEQPEQVARPTDRQPSIITARTPHARSHIDFPDITEEELNRRADAADALFRELVRRAIEPDQDSVAPSQRKRKR